MTHIVPQGTARKVVKIENRDDGDHKAGRVHKPSQRRTFQVSSCQRADINSNGTKVEIMNRKRDKAEQRTGNKSPQRKRCQTEKIVGNFTRKKRDQTRQQHNLPSLRSELVA